MAYTFWLEDVSSAGDESSHGSADETSDDEASSSASVGASGFVACMCWRVSLDGQEVGEDSAGHGEVSALPLAPEVSAARSEPEVPASSGANVWAIGVLNGACCAQVRLQAFAPLHHRRHVPT